jgi:hypothetical protein
VVLCFMFAFDVSSVSSGVKRVVKSVGVISG